MATLTVTIPAEVADELAEQAVRERRPVEDIAAERLAAPSRPADCAEQAEDDLPDIDPMSWTDPMKPSPVLSAEAAEDLWRRTQEWTPPPALVRLLREHRQRFPRTGGGDG